MPQKEFKKILIINPYGIGDVLFTTPLLANLKKAYPESFIGVLLGSRTKDILENNPDVDEIYVFDKGRFDSLPKVKALKMLFNLIRDLKKEKFDLSIDLSNSSQYGFIEKFFLNIPKRVGFDYKRRGRYLTDKIELKGYEEKHVVEYYLDLIRHLDIELENKTLKFPLKEEDLIWARNFLKENNVSFHNLIIGIIPGGGSSWGKDASYKHWDRENFAKLSDRLSSDLKARIIIMGSSHEEKICQEILSLIDVDKNKVIFACGKTTLGQLAALISLCNLVICNDGGPLHIAVSQATPTVSIFGPVNDKIYGPYFNKVKNYILRTNLTCQPCYKDFKYKPCQERKCLDLITVEQVLKTVKLAIKSNK